MDNEVVGRMRRERGRMDFEGDVKGREGSRREAKEVGGRRGR